MAIKILGPEPDLRGMAEALQALCRIGPDQRFLQKAAVSIGLGLGISARRSI
jgi:hypothetical protein